MQSLVQIAHRSMNKFSLDVLEVHHLPSEDRDTPPEKYPLIPYFLF